MKALDARGYAREKATMATLKNAKNEKETPKLAWATSWPQRAYNMGLGQQDFAFRMNIARARKGRCICVCMF
jgi:hypothetical protein